MFPMPKDVPLSKSLFSKPSLLCSIATTPRRQHQELLCFITTIRRVLKEQVYKWGFKEVTMKLAPTKTPTMTKMDTNFFCIASLGASSTANLCHEIFGHVV
jgi:hypothetical protein